MATSWLAGSRRWLARPFRFGVVGAISSGVQIGCLIALARLGLHHLLANGAALTIATQVNFLLSARVIWPDRPTSIARSGTLLRRLLAFNAMSVTTLLLNEIVFAAADQMLPYVIAAICGIAVAAPINYLAGHYLIFRRSEGIDHHEQRRVRLRRLPGAQ